MIKTSKKRKGKESEKREKGEKKKGNGGKMRPRDERCNNNKTKDNT